ncbi:MAG: hypothetical protein V1846_01485 [Candidatus Komeilibacteria bacterium]
MADFDWKQNDEKSGINLLPDDMRQKEVKELASTPEQQVELRRPKKIDADVPEGKVPWFSFRSWFGRQPKAKKIKVKSEAGELPKSKLSFRLIPSKKRQEQEELERAKEEALRHHILREVFQKKGLPLPENDNSIFNQERRQKQHNLERQIGDMDIDSAGQPAGNKTELVSEAAAISIPKPDMKISQELPEVPLVKPEAVPVPLPQQPPVEPITPALPPQPPQPEEVAEKLLPAVPVVKPPVPSAPETPDKPAAKGFHFPTGVFTAKIKSKDHPKSVFGVNLIPTSITVKSWSQVQSIFFTAIIVTVIVMAAAYGGLLLWDREIERQTAEVDTKIQTAETEILKFQGLKDQIAAIENQIRDIESLLGKHIYWTQFFTLLEKYTVTDVYFDRFASGISGNLTLTAHGTDFMTAARQLKLLQSPEAKEFITSVNINSVQDSGSGVTFSIDLQLNNQLFYYAHASSTQQ